MNDGSSPRGDSAQEERSLAELMKELSTQASTLAQKEVELAKAEMAVKAKRLGIGAGAFGAAALVGLFALGALTATAILALATALAPWLAALIVTAVYAATAGVLALVGKSRIEAGTPPVPEQAVESVKEDVEWTKTKAKQART
jgi:lipopolysaccharide export LptBFGC system permease protein LptF